MNEVVIPLKLSGIAALKAELKDLKNQMADAANPEAFAALADRAGEAQKQINKVNGAINDFKKGSNLDQARASFDGLSQSIMNMDFTNAAKQSANLKQTLGSLTPADLTKQFTGFISTLKNVGGAFLKLGATILVNPIFLIVAAVVAIIAVIALVLKSFGVLDDVMKALMAPINALIAGFKELTDWLGLTTFAAEDNAAKTLEANEKVKKSSEERTAIVTADLGREIAELKAAGKDTTKLEEERSNVQIKEANNRKKTAIDAIEGQKALGDKADKEKLAELRKQVIAENEIIKQGYSDKIVAKNTADKKESDEADKKQKEAEAKAKEARDKRIAADKASEAEIAAARKIITDSTKTAQQIEIDDLKAAYKKKIETAQKFNNDTTALVEAQAIQVFEINKKYADQANANQLALDDTNLANLKAFEAKQLEIKKEAKAKEVEAAEYAKNLMIKIDQERLQQKRSIEDAAINLATSSINFLQTIAGKNKGIQKAAIIAENAVAIAKMVMANNAANAGALATPQAILTSGASAIPVIAMNNISTALGIAATIAATGKALSAVGGGSAGSKPNQPGPPSGGGGGETATTAVAPASGPSLFGQANTGSQINAGDNSNQNITVTAVVSETEMTATQHFINNIQQNSVL